MAQPQLSNQTLASVASHAAVPRYDRVAVRPGIVHLGVGAFHRAHQAVFTDDCLNAGEMEWGICAASLRSTATSDALTPQNSLYTMAVREGSEQRLRVVGSIKEILTASRSAESLLAAMADPGTRIVSLTITEKGYTANLGTGDLLTDHPDINHDLRAAGVPRSALGFIALALARRREAGVAPFTILSCDNTPQNGRLLRRVLLQLALERDPGLAAWIGDEVRCPSTMVDRIVPATTDADRASISATLGAEDAWPVIAEPFFQWVIEDKFTTGRPFWERSGVEFVTDVAPFERMKLRLLNGAHSAIAAIGRVAGFSTVAEAFGDATIRAFVGSYWKQAIPTLAPGIDGRAYTERLAARFDNSSLAHKTAQIATDASQKIPQRILEPLRELRAAGAPSHALAFAIAAWIRSCAGADERGQTMPLNDPVFEGWPARPDQDHASAAEIVRAFLEFAPVFGRMPQDDPFLAPAIAAALEDILQMGMLAAAGKCAASHLSMRQS